MVHVMHTAGLQEFKFPVLKSLSQLVVHSSLWSLHLFISQFCSYFLYFLSLDPLSFCEQLLKQPSLVCGAACSSIFVYVYTVHCLGSNEELINRVFPPVPWAGGWSSQAELSPNTDTHRNTPCTYDGRRAVEPVWPGREGTQGGCSRSGPQSGPRGEKVVVGVQRSNFQRPILAMGFGFCTGIQNQLAVLTGLALVELKEKLG